MDDITIENEPIAEQVKQHSRAITHKAIRKGDIKKEACLFCGATKKLHIHHIDYFDPYNIAWLCQPHHVYVHNVINRGYLPGVVNMINYKHN